MKKFITIPIAQPNSEEYILSLRSDLEKRKNIKAKMPSKKPITTLPHLI
jgi:hypothetical protein